MKVYLFATLRGFFGRNESVEIAGNNIRTVLNGLVDEYPEAGKIIFDENQNIREFIHIYVNDEDYTSSELWEKTFCNEDEIILFPSIAVGERAREGNLISDERRKEIVLDDKEIDRFSKHLMLRDIGVKTKRIKSGWLC